MSARKQALLDEALPKLALPAVDGPLDPAGLFGFAPERLVLEVGFGKGELLAALAEAHPKTGFIGAEAYINGAVGLLDRIESRKLGNIRLWADDANMLMARLPDGCLDQFWLVHPDPWPKRRHAKRRFVNPSQLDTIARLLKPGGAFRLSTDHPVYRQWAVIQMAARRDFEWTAERPADWRTRPADWPETRYAQKALEGAPVFLIYQRL